MRGLLWIVAALAALALVQASSAISVFLVALIGQRSMYDMRVQVFDHLQRQALRFIDRNPVGRLLNRVTNDIEKIQQTIVDGVVAAISDLLSIAVVFAVMVYVNWRSSLVA